MPGLDRVVLSHLRRELDRVPGKREWMCGLPIKDGKDALNVNWFEAAICSMSGERLGHNELPTRPP
ncbi:MAG: hypothetical protein J4F49_06405 [Rhodobacteraceae bacterium]|nr:hypothetical protein [Paracoccaceae bacterium]